MFLNDLFVVLQPYMFLDVFHYFGHHGRPGYQTFHPRLFFNYCNPAIMLIKKSFALGVLRYGFGTKAAKICDLAT